MTGVFTTIEMKKTYLKHLEETYVYVEERLKEYPMDPGKLREIVYVFPRRTQLFAMFEAIEQNDFNAVSTGFARIAIGLGNIDSGIFKREQAKTKIDLVMAENTIKRGWRMVGDGMGVIGQVLGTIRSSFLDVVAQKAGMTEKSFADKYPALEDAEFHTQPYAYKQRVVLAFKNQSEERFGPFRFVAEPEGVLVFMKDETVPTAKIRIEELKPYLK